MTFDCFTQQQISVSIEFVNIDIDFDSDSDMLSCFSFPKNDNKYIWDYFEINSTEKATKTKIVQVKKIIVQVNNETDSGNWKKYT